MTYNSCGNDERMGKNQVGVYQQKWEKIKFQP